MINVVTTESKSEQHVVDLRVDTVDMQVIVRAGMFRIMGKVYNLADDEGFTVVPSDKKQFITGNLYFDAGEEEAHVLVDSIEEGDMRYDWLEANMENLHGLFELRVPANIASLVEVDITVYRMVQS